MLRNAVTVKTEPDNYDVFRSMEMIRFDGMRNKTMAAPVN